jgi:hypothetical protein
MFRRFAQGFAGLVAVVFVAACSSGGAVGGGGSVISIGPTFAPMSVYASNTSQNAISIYNAGATSGGPTNQVGGSSTQLNGPQYLAFDNVGNLFVSAYSNSTNLGQLVEIKALATGNVLPFDVLSLGKAHPRGIGEYMVTPSASASPVPYLAVGLVDPTQPLTFSSQVQVYQGGTLSTFGVLQTLAGPLTGLNVPSGVAVDSTQKFYVTNLQGASVTVYSIPTPSPTPSPTATPAPTPTPTAAPSGTTASPSPTPSPTPTPLNIAPVATIAGGASGIGQPTGIALDASGNIYVSDQKSTICSCPAILIFPAGSNGAVAPKVISGGATLLVAPTDVKVDSNGLIYVADNTAAGSGVVYVFAKGATGNTAPTVTLTSSGTVTGLALSP